MALKTLRPPAPSSAASSPVTSSVRIMQQFYYYGRPRSVNNRASMVRVLFEPGSIGQGWQPIMSESTQFSTARMALAGLRGLICLGLLLLSDGLAAAEPLVTEGFINAPVREVWRLFTTSEGYKAFGVAQA